MESNKAPLSDLLRTLELELRGYIRYKLSSLDLDWWDRRVSKHIRTLCEDRKKKTETQWPWQSLPHSHPIEYANFNDYITIITQRSNWKDAFEGVLGAKIILQGKFKELEIARNLIAHNREITPDAGEQFRQNVKYILDLIGLDSNFVEFKKHRGSDWIEYAERCSEDDIIWIVAGNSWLFNQMTYFKEKNVALGRKKVDLLFKDDAGFKTYVEVKLSEFKPTQIQEYARLLKPDLKKGLCRLIWFIPSAFERRVNPTLNRKLVKAGVDVIYYDIDFFTEWAYMRRQASMLLKHVHGYLSSPFEYTIGRKSHLTFKHSFQNIPDALYFYGYTEKDGKRKKVGFHLATLGWYLDLLRNLSSPNSPFIQTSPDLLLKLILELLEYPYLYKDTKATPKQIYRPLGVVDRTGFINHLINYKKKGRIQYIKDETERQHQNIRRFYKHIFKRFMKRIRSKYKLEDRLLELAREDLLEAIVHKVSKTKTQMNTLPAGRFRDGIVEEFKLQEALLTETIGTTGFKAKNTRTEDKRTYKANMAKRLIEIMSLKRIIDVHTYIVPTYEILILVRDEAKIQGVQTFRHNKDGRIRRDLLR